MLLVLVMKMGRSSTPRGRPAQSSQAAPHTAPHHPVKITSLYLSGGVKLEAAIRF